MQKAKADKEWFKRGLAARRQSMRALARHMGMDVAQLSRTFDGTRRMQLDEANAIAAFIQAPVSEVLKHAGISAEQQTPQEPLILLAATINNNGLIERLKEPKALPRSVIERAIAAITSNNGTGNMMAAQIRAIDGPLIVMDDAVLLFRHTSEVEPTSHGVLSVCRTDDGEQLLAKIETSRKTGESRLILVTGKVKDVMLQTATPVLAIIP